MSDVLTATWFRSRLITAVLLAPAALCGDSVLPGLGSFFERFLSVFMHRWLNQAFNYIVDFFEAPCFFWEECC